MTHKKYLIFIVFSFLFNGVTFSQSVITNPIEVTRADDSVIRYYLELKENDSHTEYLFTIIQGSDCNSVRNMTSINKLKNIYPNADVLTVEKYGIDDCLDYSDLTERPDCPESYIECDNPKQRASDLDRVISALRNEYGYAKFVIVGGSEGALVANILTANTDYINSTILLGGGGRFFLDDIIHSMQSTIDSEYEREATIKGFKIFSEYILSHESFEISMSNHGYSWWRIMLSIDQLELLRRIDTPVLILQGGLDNSASPEQATKMAESLRNEGKDNINYFFYPEYNHSLNLSFNDDSSERIITNIQEWITGKTN